MFIGFVILKNISLSRKTIRWHYEFQRLVRAQLLRGDNRVKDLQRCESWSQVMIQNSSEHRWPHGSPTDWEIRIQPGSCLAHQAGCNTINDEWWKEAEKTCLWFSHYITVVCNRYSAETSGRIPLMFFALFCGSHVICYSNNKSKYNFLFNVCFLRTNPYRSSSASIFAT